MKKITTRIGLVLPESSAFEEQLKKEFNNQKIRFNAFTGIWEIKGKNYNHFLSYHENRESKIITEKIKQLKGVIILNVCLALIFLMITFLDKKFHWGLGITYLVLLFVFFSSVLNWVLMNLNPDYDLQLENEHIKMIKYFTKYRMTS